MSLACIVIGLTLLVVSWAIVLWLLCAYEARIAGLEAQLRRPCPHGQAAQGTAWEPPL
jgi:TM2 domain-containing membrane protein YozV